MENSLFNKYLEFYSKYPTEAETENLLLNNYKFVKKSDSNYTLIKVDDDFFIDVTHTVHYPYNSGIQRVVRKLVLELNKLNYKFTLIKFSTTGQPIKLSPFEIDKFYNWEKHIQSTDLFIQNSIGTNIKKIIPYAKRFIPSSLWNKLKYIYHYILEKKRSNKPFLSNNENTIVLDLRNKKLLLPEVTTESERVHAISILSKYYNTNISCILYDLIPVTHPEFCTVGYDFIHYLRIFRSINNVLSISEHTSDELTNFNKISKREVNHPLSIKTIYLGGDFDNSECPILPIISDKKIILMVARFEPRKNIRRVLAALEILYKDNIDFKFVLIGNPGWLQESILQDLSEMKEKGYDIEYHMRVPDTELIKWYKSCYFTIFCSITEGFGLPIIESVLFEKPCITTNSGSQAEVANRIGGCLLANPLDIQDIYSKAKELIINKSLYQKLEAETKKAKWKSWSEYASDVYNALKE